MINFDEFYRDSYKRQVGTVKKYLKCDYSTAEDIVMEAYARALKYQLSYDPDRSPINTWFNSIIFNLIKEHTTEPPREEYNENRSSGVWTKVEHELFRKELKKVRNKDHRYILTLFYILGYSSKDISQILYDYSQTNVTTICSRFKQKLSNKYGVNI